MKPLILAAMILVGGCGDWVNHQQIKKANELCANNGGVDRIKAVSDLFGFVHGVNCKNGAEFYSVHTDGAK